MMDVDDQPNLDIDPYELADAVDISGKIAKDFYTNMVNSPQ